MRSGIPGVHKFGQPLCLTTMEDRLQIILLALQCYWVMKAQAKQLPAEMLPMGFTENTRFSQIQFFDSFVQKRITFSDEAWPHSRCQLMQTIYAVSQNCPFLIHAQQPPHASHNGKQYVVDLEPVGQPACSRYSDHIPRQACELKSSIR